MSKTNTHKDHALKMLTEYLSDGNRKMFALCVGSTDGANGTNFKRVFTTISDGRLINLNLYVARLLGLRRDAFNNISTRMTVHEVVTAIADKIGGTVDVTPI